MRGSLVCGMFGFGEDFPDHVEFENGAAAPLLVAAQPLSRERQHSIQYYGKSVAITLFVAEFVATIGLARGESPGPGTLFGAATMLGYGGFFQLYGAVVQLRSAQIDTAAARETLRNINLTARTFWITALAVMSTLAVAMTADSSADNPDQSVQLLAIIPACFAMITAGCFARIHREARIPAPEPVALLAPGPDYTLEHRTEAETLFDFIEASSQNRERLALLLTSEEYAQFFTDHRFSLQLECFITHSLPESSAATIWEGNNPLGKPPYGTVFDAVAIREWTSLRAPSLHPLTRARYTADDVRAPHPEWIRLYKAFAQVAMKPEVQALIRGSSTALAAHAMGGGGGGSVGATGLDAV